MVQASRTGYLIF